MRNIEKQVDFAKSKITTRQEMNVSEIMELFEIFGNERNVKSGVYAAIVKAFYFGFAIGYKSKKKGGLR